jgi:hypothetical protein
LSFPLNQDTEAFGRRWLHNAFHISGKLRTLQNLTLRY